MNDEEIRFKDIGIQQTENVSEWMIAMALDLKRLCNSRAEPRGGQSFGSQIW